MRARRRRTCAAAAICLATLAAPASAGAAQDRQTPARPIPRAAAVIRFTNITGEPTDDWIGPGIAETVAGDLRALDGLTVIGRESMLDALNGLGANAREEPDERVALDLGRRLSATWLVSGGYQHLGARLRVTARVVDVATGSIVCTVKIDRAADDIFGLQDAIGVELKQGLAAALADADANRQEPAAAVAAPIEGATTAAFGAPAAARDANPVAAGRDSIGLAAIIGPPAPVPPAVISRDDRGRATVRAVRIERPIRLDGRLDEETYLTVPAIGDFIQLEPDEGEPATEKTDTWIFFDDRNLYVSARCWDSQPERMVANELRRDGNVTQNENFVVILDTFYDHRNGSFFQTNPLGAIREQAITDEGNPNASWNTVWEVRTGRFEGGWTLEMVIPFKSLRYRGAGSQVWGINFRRTVRWKNEASYLTRMPAAYGNVAIHYLSLAATLVGLETPAQSMNLEIKPYLVSSLTTDHATSVPFHNRLDRSGGFDVKYGLTRSLIADATVNTDFAQVEEDLQQVNLTRFSLFFPEKREFFLEGQGIFNFGLGGGSFGTGGAGGSLGGAADVPLMFFSRRIGLSQGQAVPVVAGGRVTGKAGRYGIGMVNIQTDEKPSAGAVATNFSIVRLKRDVLRRSNIGVIATRRSPTTGNDDSNLAVGLDANMLFFENLTINSYYARTSDTFAGVFTSKQRPDPEVDESSYRARLEYAADRYGLQLEHLMVGNGFNPEIGFMRRANFRRNTVGARFSPRPRSSRLVRKLVWEGGFDHITDAKNLVVENWEAQGNFRVEFNTGDHWNMEYTRDYEYLAERFQIAPRVTVPSGGYTYQFLRMGYMLGPQHRVSGRATASNGTFYEGRRTEASYSGRVALGAHLNFEPGITLNWVTLPQGDFSARLMTTRAIVTPTPRMVVSGLFQYNASAHTLNSNVRLRWEYAGGSELFVVYSDGRDTLASGVPELLNRSLALKLTRLLRF